VYSSGPMAGCTTAITKTAKNQGSASISGLIRGGSLATGRMASNMVSAP
jgi:hypothetical protein